MPTHACRVAEAGLTKLVLCVTCGAVTRPVEVAAHRGLPGLYREALRYPMDHGGLFVLAGLGAVSWFLNHLPFFGGLLVGGMLSTYLFSVVRASVAGDDEPPIPADFVDWGDLVRPLVKAWAALLVAWLPLVLVLWFGAPLPGVARVALALVAAALGLAWTPGALAAAAFSDDLASAANPARVLALITRIPRDYALTVAALQALALAAFVVASLADRAARALWFVPVLPTVAWWSASLYVPVVMARVLGVMLRERRIEIGLDG